jgi:hypothetical protein
MHYTMGLHIITVYHNALSFPLSHPVQAERETPLCILIFPQPTAITHIPLGVCLRNSEPRDTESFPSSTKPAVCHLSGQRQSSDEVRYDLHILPPLSWVYLNIALIILSRIIKQHGDLWSINLQRNAVEIC